MEIFIFFLFNIFLNSFITFFSIVILVKIFLWLFRIKTTRLKIFCRLIPLLKLPLDLLLYDFSKWGYLHQINPLTIPYGTRSIDLSFSSHTPTLKTLFFPFTTDFQLMMNDRLFSFTFADLLVWKLPFYVISLVVSSVFLTSLVLIMRKCFHFTQDKRELSRLKKDSEILEEKEIFPLAQKDNHQKKMIPSKKSTSKSF